MSQLARRFVIVLFLLCFSSLIVPAQQRSPEQQPRKVIWHSRDPDPDTEENEFKQEFFERMAYANEHFSSGKPGRLTDRGRIYIKFGR